MNETNAMSKVKSDVDDDDQSKIHTAADTQEAVSIARRCVNKCNRAGEFSRARSDFGCYLEVRYLAYLCTVRRVKLASTKRRSTLAA